MTTELIAHGDGCRRPAPQLQIRHHLPVVICYGCGASAVLDLPALIDDIATRLSNLERQTTTTTTTARQETSR